LTQDTTSVAIRAEQPGDREAIARVVAGAFGSPVEARLVERIRASANFVPEWSLVAELDGRIVGHVMVSFVTLSDGDAEHRVASLSPLAVSPDAQRRGIGSALVRAVCDRVDGAREPLVVLEGSPHYYRRFGFEHSARYGIRIKLPDWAPPEAAQVLRLQNYDSSVRGRLVYPPAFDEVADEPRTVRDPEPDLSVRALEPGDWEVLRDLRYGAMTDTPDAFGSTLARERTLAEDEWRRRATNTAVAFHNSRPVGLVGCVVIDREAELVSMWVAPNARRLGAGRALVDWARTRARELGFTDITLWVADGNDDAARFYEECGFSRTGRRAPFERDATAFRNQMSRPA